MKEILIVQYTGSFPEFAICCTGKYALYNQDRAQWHETKHPPKTIAKYVNPNKDKFFLKLELE